MVRTHPRTPVRTFPPAPSRAWTGFVAALLLVPLGAAGQVPEVRPAEEGPATRPWSLSLGPGVTTNVSRPGDSTVTLTLAVSWNVAGDWTVTVAPYWERELESNGTGTWQAYDEVSLALAVGYTFAPRWTVSLELDLGLVENGAGAWNRNAEYGVGAGLSYAIPLGERWNLVLGPEISWKWSDGEWSVGLNTGVSFDL